MLPVLEELGYPKENLFVEKHCRVDKKDLYSDVYIEVDNGTGILTNGSRYILINTDFGYKNIGEESIWQSVVLDIDFGMDSSRRNEKFIVYLGF